ncbi:alpha/beta hydrolase [Mammaliicoccus sciuri]|uniref:alpha/beta fold hydrolase n=1 Tax=Mammaliicoccus TaxID=2803850 RepID=UPI001E546945|nr:alpha/beta hydrolase [Mammaliicoccus sciuri]MCD8777823.1 alpha/beta hydrolase [Mammaliicoccus sciuri]MCD8779864.1 alpha/beta hydrolase [Mammaliicoccus sciuri]MEB6058322.1 alpha/beta hydrolase [Mammaliicoccus sciuri]
MFEKLYVDAKRGKFEVFKKGNGEPLIYTHHYSQFNENGDYFSQLLSKYYTVYIINLRGAGSSDGSTKECTYSMEDTVRDLESIKEKLGIKKWTMAGHSTGGFLALYYAILYPKSLKEIIAGGIAASGEYMNHAKSIYNEGNPSHNRLMEIFKLLENQELTIEEKRALNKEWVMMSLHQKDAYYEMINIKQSGKVLSDRLNYFSEELPYYNITNQLRDTETRAYIYCGIYDAQCPYEFSKEVSLNMPNAKLEIFNESNHYPFFEEKEKFINYVEDIVSSSRKSC